MRVSALANHIIDELGITAPQDLQQLDLIAYQRGAVVVNGPLHGAEARLVAVGRKAVITVSTATTDLRRRRFSIAHELGHFEIQRSGLVLCTSKDLDAWPWQSKQNDEAEANEFAAGLLLPERLFALSV